MAYTGSDILKIAKGKSEPVAVETVTPKVAVTPAVTIPTVETPKTELTKTEKQAQKRAEYDKALSTLEPGKLFGNIKSLRQQGYSPLEIAKIGLYANNKSKAEDAQKVSDFVQGIYDKGVESQLGMNKVIAKTVGNIWGFDANKVNNVLGFGTDMGKTVASVPLKMVGTLSDVATLPEKLTAVSGQKTADMGDFADDVSDKMRTEVKENNDIKVGDGAVGKAVKFLNGGNDDLFDFAYDTATSGLDSLATSYVFGPAAEFILAGGAMTDKYNDMVSQGASVPQALASGIVNGLAEYAGEHISLGMLRNMTKAPVADKKSFISNIVKSILGNAKEEALTETINATYDVLIDGALSDGAFSEYEKSVKQYMKDGMSENDAVKKALADKVSQISGAAVGGGLMGGAFGLLGGTNAKQTDSITTEASKNAFPAFSDDFTEQDGQLSTTELKPSEKAVQQNTAIVPAVEQNTDIVPTKSDIVPTSDIVRADEQNQIAVPTAELSTESKGDKVRNISRQLLGGNTTAIRDAVSNEFKTEPRMYTALHNQDTWDSAQRLFESQTLEESQAMYEKMLADKDPRAVALGLGIANAFSDAGDYTMATKIIDDLSEQGTKAGQFTQAFTLLYLGNNPLAVENMLNKRLDAITAETGQDVRLTDSEREELRSIQKGDSDSLKGFIDKIDYRLSQQINPSLWKKYNELRKLGMLFNTRTHLRNIVSNALTQKLRYLSDRVAGIVESGYQLFNKDYQKTQSIKAPTRATLQAANDVATEYLKSLKLDSKYDDARTVGQNVQTFKDGKNGETIKAKGQERVERIANHPIVKFLSEHSYFDWANAILSEKENVTGSRTQNLINFDYALLGTIEDDPFVQANFRERLASYMQANDITDARQVPDIAKEIAYQEALVATFKDDNWISNMMLKMRDALNTKLPLGDLLLPFAKTPASIASQSLNYSAVGMAGAVVDAFKKSGDIQVSNRIIDLIKKDIDKETAKAKPDTDAIAGLNSKLESAMKQRNKAVSEVITKFSKGLTGTALTLVGFLLAKAGVVTGKTPEDKDEKAFAEQLGYQPYSFHIGDKYYQFSWAEPSAVPLIFGASFFDATKDADGFMKALKDGTLNSFNQWFESSPMSSVASLLGSGSYESIGENFVHSFLEDLVPVPSLVRALAKTADTTKRNTYSSDKTRSIVKNTVAGIPVLSKTLPAQYDTWGNEKKTAESTADAFFANFINPGKTSYDKSTPIDDEINRLGKIDKKAYPLSVGNSIQIGGETVKLTEAQKSAYQKAVGEASYTMAESCLNNMYYTSLTDEEKISALAKIYEFANALGKSQFGYDVENSYKTLFTAFSDGGYDAVVNYIIFKKKADSNGNGSVTKEELIPFLDNSLSNNSDKEFYFGLLSNAKNPYSAAVPEQTETQDATSFSDLVKSKMK